MVTVALSHWTAQIREATVEGLGSSSNAQLHDVTWQGATATIVVTTEDGTVPGIDSLTAALVDRLPSLVEVYLDAGVAVTTPVLAR